MNNYCAICGGLLETYQEQIDNVCTTCTKEIYNEEKNPEMTLKEYLNKRTDETFLKILTSLAGISAILATLIEKNGFTAFGFVFLMIFLGYQMGSIVRYGLIKMGLEELIPKIQDPI